jgi:hypothetical protein
MPAIDDGHKSNRIGGGTKWIVLIPAKQRATRSPTSPE